MNISTAIKRYWGLAAVSLALIAHIVWAIIDHALSADPNHTIDWWKKVFSYFIFESAIIGYVEFLLMKHRLEEMHETFSENNKDFRRVLNFFVHGKRKAQKAKFLQALGSILDNVDEDLALEEFRGNRFMTKMRLFMLAFHTNNYRDYVERKTKVAGEHGRTLLFNSENVDLLNEVWRAVLDSARNSAFTVDYPIGVTTLGSTTEELWTKLHESVVQRMPAKYSRVFVCDKQDFQRMEKIRLAMLAQSQVKVLVGVIEKRAYDLIYDAAASGSSVSEDYHDLMLVDSVVVGLSTSSDKKKGYRISSRNADVDLAATIKKALLAQWGKDVLTPANADLNNGIGAFKAYLKRTAPSQW